METLEIADRNIPAPDIVVEITTPTTLMGALVGRVDDDFRGGVKLVSIIFPRHRLMWLYLSAEEIRVIPLPSQSFSEPLETRDQGEAPGTGERTIGHNAIRPEE